MQKDREEMNKKRWEHLKIKHVKVIFLPNHRISGLNYGSPTFSRELPVLTGNESPVKIYGWKINT